MDPSQKPSNPLHNWIGIFPPVAPPYMFSEQSSGRQSLHPPHPPQPSAHVLGPLRQASVPGLLIGPAGMAPISWICYNHLRSSHSCQEQGKCPSALQARPLNPSRALPIFLYTFPMSDLLITGFNIIVKQVRISPTLKFLQVQREFCHLFQS